MNVDQVHRAADSHKRRRRKGRGSGSGNGKTAGRGHKGQLSRAGASRHPGFEGGKMPLVRRIPKRGFNNKWAPIIAIVNIDDLQKHFKSSDKVTPESLREKNLAKGRYDQLKVLGTGTLNKKLTVSAHLFSKTALDKIQQAGGQTIVLPGKASVGSKREKTRVKSPA